MVLFLLFIRFLFIFGKQIPEQWLIISYPRIKMPQTHVVHLGNSKELMQVAEDSVAKRVLREHVRESLGIRSEDILFAIINSTCPK